MFGHRKKTSRGLLHPPSGAFAPPGGNSYFLPNKLADDFRWGFMFGFGSGLDVSRGDYETMLAEYNKVAVY